MIKQTVSESIFIDSFQGSYKNNFSYNGKKALFEHLEQLSEDMGEDIELDPIAICCEYSEFESPWEAMEQYQPEDMPTIDESEGMGLLELEEAQQNAALEWLRENTIVIEFDNMDYSQGLNAPVEKRVIIQDF